MGRRPLWLNRRDTIGVRVSMLPRLVVQRNRPRREARRIPAFYIRLSGMARKGVKPAARW